MDFSQAAGLIYGELSNWIRATIRFMPKMAVAIILLMVFAVLSRWVSKWATHGFTRISHNVSLINLSGALIRVLVVAVGLFMALSILGLEKTVASLLAGAGVLALAVGFAFQDLTANFISGTMIALAQPIRVGDNVETNGFSGKVLDIKLRSIVIDNGKGQTVELPSKDVFQKPIINYSRIGRRRIEVPAGVSYLEDLTSVQKIALASITQLPFVLNDFPVELNYRKFGDSNIEFSVLFWVDPTKTNSQLALSEAIIAIKNAFDTHKILIVFAAQTYDLKAKQMNPQAT